MRNEKEEELKKKYIFKKIKKLKKSFMVMAEVIFLHDSTVDRLEFGDVEDFSLFTIIESTLFLTAYTTHTCA